MSKGILYVIEAAIAAMIILLFLFSFLILIKSEKEHVDYEEIYSLLKSLDDADILEEIVSNVTLYKYYFEDCYLTLIDENGVVYSNLKEEGNYITINYYFLEKNTGRKYLIKLYCAF